MAAKVSLGDIQSALSSENVNVAGGSIIEGNREYLIRTLNEFESVETIRSLKIRRSDGVLVPLPRPCNSNVGVPRTGSLFFFEWRACC